MSPISPIGPIIKVCGMRDPDNIRAVEELLTEFSTAWMGFIFWPPSQRYVSERPAYLPEHCKRVGVFVDEDIEQVKRIAADYALDFIQLHGHESPEYLRALKGQEARDKGQEASVKSPLSIIKAFSIATAADLAATKPYEGLADYFLFDTKAQLPGGSGQHFDWSVLADYTGATPFLLSGGIGPDDAEALQSTLLREGAGPLAHCVGIDLNSRFELAPALKDVAALRSFLYQFNCKS